MLSWWKLSGDPRRPSVGGSPDFLAKLLANPDKIMKFENFENYVWICQ